MTDRLINEFDRNKGDAKQKKELHDALFGNSCGERSRNHSKNNKGGKGDRGPSKNWNEESTGKMNFRCHFCHEKGHFQRECPKRKAENKSSVSFCEQKEPEVSERDFYLPEFAL